jgi:hypothetical protein
MDSTVQARLQADQTFAGADLTITGALGRCPLYNKLGYVPKSLRSRT